jgi:hypothetical protein
VQADLAGLQIDLRALADDGADLHVDHAVGAEAADRRAGLRVERDQAVRWSRRSRGRHPCRRSMGRPRPGLARRVGRRARLPFSAHLLRRPPSSATTECAPPVAKMTPLTISALELEPAACRDCRS